MLSPDLRWIAYHDETEGYIVVRPFPNVSGGRWQVSPPNSKWPLWSRDGRELFYVSADWQVTSVPVRNTPSLQLGTPSPLFRLNAGAPWLKFDVAPDGLRFLAIVSDVVVGAQPLTLISNWMAKVRP